MTKKREKQLIQEGHYLAEVDVELIETDDAWSPHLSPADAGKLDEVRRALQREDTLAASKLARVYQLTPIHAA